MGQKNSHLTMLHPSIMDMRGYKVKVLELPPSQLTTEMLRRTNKYLLRLHPDKLDLVGRHDCVRVCEISFYDIRALNQVDRFIIISLGRSSCFGQGRMSLRCSKTLCSSLISSSFIGRASRLSYEVSPSLNHRSELSNSDRLPQQVPSTPQHQRQLLRLPPAPRPPATSGSIASTDLASSVDTLSTNLASVGLAGVSSRSSLNSASNSSRLTPSWPLSSNQSGRSAGGTFVGADNEETDENDGYLPMLPGSRRVSMVAVAAPGNLPTPPAPSVAAAGGAALTDEYVLPVANPDFHSMFDVYVGDNEPEERAGDTDNRLVYQNLPSPASVIGSGRYARIDWSQVMQDSLQYLDSSSASASAAPSAVATAADDSADNALNYVSIDSARTQAIRDLIVDKAEGIGKPG